jgi:RimJ/RimL family protein N-acetyltransferase
MSEIAELLAINDDFFENEEEIASYIRRGNAFTFRNDEDQLLACGILTRVIEDRDAIDLGMLVASNFRGQGLAKYVVRWLISYCELKGARPIAGCDVNNLASKRALESAGFIGEYQLLEIQLD